MEVFKLKEIVRERGKEGIEEKQGEGLSVQI